MKKNAIILILSFVISFGYAQSENYEKAMKDNLSKLEKVQNKEDINKLSNKFERIAQAEEDKWLPWYYAAYCAITECFMGTPADMIDAQLDKAQAFLDKAVELSPNNDELIVLQGMLYQGRIQVDPQMRGQQYSMKSNASFQKAMSMNPDNPRAYLLMAQNLLYTPAAYGGGAEAACKQYNTAAEKFATFKPKSDLSPNWGKEMNEEMIQQNCK